MSRPKPIKKHNLDLYRNLSCNIRFIRERKGVAPAELAEKAEISVSYLAMLESPARFVNPSLEVIFDLSKGLDIQPSLLFRDMYPVRMTFTAGQTFGQELIRDSGTYGAQMRLIDLIQLHEDDPIGFFESCGRIYRSYFSGQIC